MAGTKHDRKPPLKKSKSLSSLFKMSKFIASAEPVEGAPPLDPARASKRYAQGGACPRGHYSPLLVCWLLVVGCWLLAVAVAVAVAVTVTVTVTVWLVLLVFVGVVADCYCVV